MILLACVLLAAALLGYVFYLPPESYAVPHKGRLVYLRERKEVVYENLRDLNFEYRAGKLSEGDYQSMRASLEEEAAQLLAEIDALERWQADQIQGVSS